MPPLMIAAGMALSEAAATAASAAVTAAATTTAAEAGAAAASAAIASGAGAAGAASAAVAGFGAAVSTGSTMLASAAYAGTMLTTSTLLGMASQAISAPKGPGVQTRTASTPLATRRIPCGKVWTAGREMSHPITWGASNKHAIFLINLADVPIGGISDFTATADDDTTQTYNGFFVNGYTAVFRKEDDTQGYEIKKTVNTYTLKKVEGFLTGKSFKFFVKFHFGSSDQTADQYMLNKLNSSRWDDTAVGVGISYARIGAYYDSDIFSGLPRFNFYLDGVKLYNPAEDDTAGGDGDQRWDDTDTYETTTNPAVIAYNIARGIYVNGSFFYGGLYEEDDLPLDYWIAAINDCAEEITNKDDTTSPRYTCGFEIDVSKPPSHYLKICETAMAGRIVKDRGQLLAFAGVAQTPVYSFTDDDMVMGESNSFVPKLGLDDLKNTIRAKYVSADKAFLQLDAPPHYSDDDVTEDGGFTLTDSLDLSMIYDCATAQRVMEAYRQRHRAQGTATRTFLATALNARVGEWISGTSASWDGTRYFEILKMVPNIRDHKLVVTLALREVPSDLGDWDADDDELDAYDVSMDSADAPDPLEASDVTAEALSELGSDGTANASVTVSYDVETDDDGETDSTIDGVVLQIGKVLLSAETGISDATTDFTDETGAGFTSDMAGRIIAIDAAGEDGDQYTGTVDAYVSATEVTLGDATDTAGTGLTYMVIDSTQYVYSDTYSEGQITARNLLGETSYAYRIRLSGIEGRSASWSDWYVITTTATATSDSEDVAAIADELAEQEAKTEALETAQEKIAAAQSDLSDGQTELETARAALSRQQSALQSALAEANVLLAEVAGLAASAQQSAAVSLQQTSDKIQASADTASARLSAAITDTKTALTDANAALTKRVSTAESELDDLSDSLTSAKAAISDTQETLSTVSDATDENTDSISTLTKQVSSAESTLDDLSDSLTSAKSAISDTQETLSTVSDATDENTDSISTLTKQVSSAESALDDLSDSLTSAKAAISDTQETLSSVSDATDENGSDISTLASEGASLSAQLAGISDDLNSLTGLITQTAVVLASVQQNVATTLVETTDKVQASADTAAAQLAASLSDTKTALTDANTALTKRVSCAESTLDDLEGTISSATAAISDTQETLSTVSSATDENSDSITALAERVTTQEALVGDASSSATFQIDTEADSDGDAAGIVTATLTATDSDGNTASVGFEAEAVVEDDTVVSQWKFIADRIDFSPSSDSSSYAYIDAQNGRIVLDDGTNMLVIGTGFGTTGDMAVWYGPTQDAISACSLSNAEFCLSATKNYFAGSLSAGDLTTKSSTSSTAEDAEAETAEFGSNGGTITVTYSLYYQSSNAVTYTYANLSAFNSVVSDLGLTKGDSGTYSGTVDDDTTTLRLDRAVAGGDYTNGVSTLNISGSTSVTAVAPTTTDSGTITYVDKISGSATYTDPAQSTDDRQYRAVMTARGEYVSTDPTQRLSVICVEEE